MNGAGTAATAPEAGRGKSISVSAIAWVAVAALFVLLRLGPVWQAPVGGPELLHLAGAWQAREGIADSRFVPTLFQALSALLLHWSTSEVPSRLLAFAATATIPAALFMLRRQLGNAGALVALLLLAFDGPGIALGTGASAMGFDLALAAWLFVALTRPGLPAWAWGIAAFLVASAGPVALPLAAASVALVAARRSRMVVDARLALAVAGALAGIAATTARFGLGIDGLRVAPIELLSAGFSEPWSTATALEGLAIYQWPFVLAGGAAAVVATLEAIRSRSRDMAATLLLLWVGIALLWLLVSLGSHTTVPVSALALPLAMVLGPAVVRAVDAMLSLQRAGWRLPGILLAVAGLLALVAIAFAGKWADAGEVRDSREAALVAGLALMAAAALGYLALDRRTSPALVPAGIVAGLALVIAPAMGVALSGREEPLPSPQSAPQSVTLRALALEAAAAAGGNVGIHPLLADDATWAFRDSDVSITARPDEAAVLIWPVNLPQPQGWAPLEGKWALVQTIAPPTAGMLAYVSWLADRNSLDVAQATVSVYVRAKE